MKTSTKILGGAFALLIIGVLSFDTTPYFINKQQEASVITSQQQSQQITDLLQKVSSLQAEINTIKKNNTLENMDEVLPYALKFFYSTVMGVTSSVPPPNTSPSVEPSPESPLIEIFPPPIVTIQDLPDGGKKITICYSETQPDVHTVCIVILIDKDGNITIDLPAMRGLTTEPMTIKIVCDKDGNCTLIYKGMIDVIMCKGKWKAGSLKFTCKFNPPGPNNNVDSLIEVYTNDKGELCYKYKNNTTGKITTTCSSYPFPMPDLFPFIKQLFPSFTPAQVPISNILPINPSLSPTKK